MCDIWNEQRRKLVQILAAGLGDRGRQVAESEYGQISTIPFYLMENGESWAADQIAGADMLYLVVDVDQYEMVERIAEKARKAGTLVVWNPGRLDQIRILPPCGCVILQSQVGPVEELELLEELFGDSNENFLLDRQALLQRMRDAVQVDVWMVKASGNGKNEQIENQLTMQEWQKPDAGTMAVGIRVSVDCRLEEVVELWQKIARQTDRAEVLWGTSFGLEQPDTMQLVLMAVTA